MREPACTVRVWTLRDHRWIVVAGELDMAATTWHGHELQSMMEEGERCVIDARGVGFVDAAGYRLLLELDEAARAHGGELTVVPSPALRRICELLDAAGRIRFSAPEDLFTEVVAPVRGEGSMRASVIDLEQRNAELEAANDALAGRLASARAGVVVLDAEGGVRFWSPWCEAAWGVSGDQAVGARFLDLRTGLPAGEVRRVLDEVLAGDVDVAEIAVDATMRDGRAVRLRLVGSPLPGADGASAGAVLLMETESG
ncbi:STAS domain-containing protein [Miltoncostaea marina]|uniref:STAS domain-containing protein n=1 Tax=Miltoncostaea marina TaxID=2843215 RepID=UPI001C3CF56F|nr:STAS domain-containing protein [Miltoncostaea marina]